MRKVYAALENCASISQEGFVEFIIQTMLFWSTVI